MKNTLLASAIALAGVFGFAGAASAQSINTAEVELELHVPTSCFVGVVDSVISATFGVLAVDGGMHTPPGPVVETSSLAHACNADVPYTIEFSTGQNGITHVASADSIVPVRILQGDSGEVPFGTVANGEEFATVGTGYQEVTSYRVSFNDDGNGTLMPAPTPGDYSNVLTIEQMF